MPVFWSHCSFCRPFCWHHSYGVAVFVEPCCIVFKHQRVSRTNHTLSLFYYSCLPALDRGLCRDGILFWRQRLVLKWTTGQSFPASLPTSLAAILVYFFSIFLAFPHSLPFKTLLLGKACSVSTPPGVWSFGLQYAILPHFSFHCRPCCSNPKQSNTIQDCLRKRSYFFLLLRNRIHQKKWMKCEHQHFKQCGIHFRMHFGSG